jgi:serine/threonine protein kinase
MINSFYFYIWYNYLHKYTPHNTTIMRYKIKNIIGEGACGKVYKAISLSNEEVSIKIIPKEKSMKTKNEITILQSLSHDNILKFIEKYETPSSVCIVTELCEYSLITFINEYNVDLSVSLKILRMILCGLEYLHSRNIIHRDIKLANILIKDNSVKICDFGLSCYEFENNYTICGTEDYIAPEIINRVDYGKSVDIYSTGKVFKTLISMKNEALPKDCLDLLNRMLEKAPEKRISAYEALRHPVFASFLPKFCDFRYLKNFRVDERFGIIEKNKNKVYLDEIEVEIIQNEDRNKFNSIVSNIDTRFGIKSTKCQTSKSEIFNIPHLELQKFNFLFKVNGLLRDVFLFTNAELKKLIYGMAYLNLKMERLPLIVVETSRYKFTYTLNDGFVYHETNYILKKKLAKNKHPQIHYTYELTDLRKKIKTKCEEIPSFLFKNINEADTKCKLSLIRVDYNNLPLIIKSSSAHLPVVSTTPTISSIGSFVDMKIRDKNIYKHKRDIGWCIKKLNTFTFLLNDGRCFEIELGRNCVAYKSKIYQIDNELPVYIKKDLKRIRELLILFL